ncbi:MAG: PqqD family protein [Lentisphaerae bacterium]|nr:PqqD family protein [Lentisphaerota bacterium]
MSESDRIYSRSADVVFRKILDEHILVPVRGQLADMQRVFALNPVAVCLWEALDQPRPLAALVARVVQTFAVDEPTAKADVERFIGELQQAGLVVDSPPARKG